LRTRRGKLNLVSRLFMGALFALVGLGGAIGMGASAWSLVSQRQTEFLAILLWSVFLFWQLFPIAATAFTENMDSTELLRFPLSFPSYLAVWLLYGSLSPATSVPLLWLLGILGGIGLANPGLVPWAALVLLVFALANILLARMIYAWLERWLSLRRTREVLGVLFVLALIGFQFLSPLLDRYGGHPPAAVMSRAKTVTAAQRWLPPGLAARSVAAAARGDLARSGWSLALLCAYGAVFLRLLSIRLRSQYRGESAGSYRLSSADAQERSPGTSGSAALPARGNGLAPAGNGPPAAAFVPGAVRAVISKELRYFLRSGPMLFTMAMPVVILLLFRLGRSEGGGSDLLRHAPQFAFPVGVAYALLMLINLAYNNLGPDAGGVQLFFAAPVRFRQVVLAKNLAHASIFAGEVLLVWVTVGILYQTPPAAITLATLAGILFALPADLAVGNCLSIYSPKKIEYGTFGRQRASQSTILISLAMRVVLFAAGVSVFYLAGHEAWPAAPVFLALSAGTVPLYLLLLGRVERAAVERREVLMAELAREA
jgi:ABC-2 type transport system permease protein